jgi:hypothetical protein
LVHRLDANAPTAASGKHPNGLKRASLALFNEPHG